MARGDALLALIQVGSDAGRPGVVTDADGRHVAGDWVRMPFPSALMEHAAVSATLAAMRGA